MNGNNIIIYSGSAAIAGTKSNEIQTECETIEISSPSAGQWREHIVGRKEWSVSVDFLLLASTDVLGLLQIGNAFTLKVVTRSGNTTTVQLEGPAILKTVTNKYTRGNLAAGSYKFVGNGALAEPTPTPPLE